MGLDLITIIIPVYNTGKYLEKCVDSVINQTYDNLQILIIDDGSNDGTSKLCDNLKKMDSRIEVYHKENEGLGLTRNFGLKYTRGKFVTFLDSDDWISTDHIENLVSGFVDDSIDVVIGSNTKCKVENNIYTKTILSLLGVYQNREIQDNVVAEMISASDTSKLDLGIPMSVCFSLYRVPLIKENDLIFPSERVCVSEDFFFNFEYFMKSKKINIIEEYGYFYRSNDNSITHTFNEKQIDRTNEFCNRVQNLLLDNHLDTLNSRKYRCFIAKYRHLIKLVCLTKSDWNTKKMNLRNICSNPALEESLEKYDIKKYRKSLYYFSLFMKNKNYFLLNVLVNLNNRMR